MIVKTIPKSDVVGALASGLCMIHCIATPFLFIAQSCSVTTIACCESSPFWWSSIDYLFIVIAFFAVYQSGLNTTKPWLKYALFATWGLLTILTFNEKYALLPLAASWKYATAFALITLHLYNLKFCQCSDESCCVA